MALTAEITPPVLAPGQTMTLTVTCPPQDRDRYIETPITITASVAGVGETTASATLRRQTDDEVVVVIDPTSRTWTLLSDDGATAVFTATA